MHASAEQNAEPTAVPDPVARRGMFGRFNAPAVVVPLFIIVMSACVLGLAIWKAADARRATLSRSEAEIRNLAHSLAEHAAHTIQATDISMSAMAELLRYQRPQADRFNRYLAETVRDLPQLREIGALDANGDWIYASTAELPRHNNADRPYFIHHRDTAGDDLRINEPLTARLTGRRTLSLSKRISNVDGSFGGVLIAGIDADYFSRFFSTFELGRHGAITLLRGDGSVLVRWPSADAGRDLPHTEAFRDRLQASPRGFYQARSPFDGMTKYIGYEKASLYPLILTVAISEDDVLAAWRSDARLDALVALALLGVVVLLACLVGSQFRYRTRVERELRQREQRYRLLADNIVDIVILLDRRGHLLFVSQSVQTILGRAPDGLIGRSCLELVHPADVETVKRAAAQLSGASPTATVIFRTFRADASTLWLEINFRLAAWSEPDKTEIVGVLRDVTPRKAMEDELTSLNSRLAQLASTDGLTGLPNRRNLDGFLRRAYADSSEVAVLMIDIDHFKGFNDAFGHQIGDNCLKDVARLIAAAAAGASGLAARYGGEEFAVVLPGGTEAGAVKVAEAIRLGIQMMALHHPTSESGVVSVSIGVAGKSAATLDDAALIGEADIALYEAKRAGRDRTVAASAIDYARAPEREMSLVPDHSAAQTFQSSSRAVDLSRAPNPRAGPADDGALADASMSRNALRT
jgi:diguanylate cyclase (GGDEF)-like protein/PAS domain S-box-containing protein